MSFGPLPLSTQTVAVTTTAQDVTVTAQGPTPTVLIQNTGAGTVFVEVGQAAQADQSLPVLAGSQLTIGLGSVSGDVVLSLIGSAAATAYVTPGSGDVSGMAATPASTT